MATVLRILFLFLASVLVINAQTDSSDPEATTEKTDVRLPPSVSGSPLGDDKSLLYFRTEETELLQCIATGVPEPKIEWYMNDGTGDRKVDLNRPNVEMLSDGRLQLTSMTSLDEGEYFCTATNINGKAMSISAKLVKATLGRYPPAVVQTYTADEGQALTIPCQEVKSVPEATYTWALAETEEDESPKSLSADERLVIAPNGYLYFANLQRTDERNGQLYKCNVFNPNLDITVGGSYAKINVNPITNVRDLPPSLTYPDPDENKPVIAVLGDKFELKCIFSGRPAPTVTWQKVGGSLPGGRYNDQLEDGTMLRIENVQWNDEAEYRCTGVNSKGSKSYTISVDVQSKPTFVTESQVPDPSQILRNQNVTQGEKAEFYCEADSLTEPFPDIDFLINANKLDDQFPGPRKKITKLSKKRAGKLLAIENVCKDCVGGGTDLMGIQCRISNPHGTVFKSVYLNVLISIAITKSPADIEITDEVKDEGMVSFECLAKADDSTPVSITWYQNDKQVFADRDDRIEIDDQNTLHIDIKDLEEEDLEEYLGDYKCVATNGYSNAEVQAQLTTPGNKGPGAVASAGVTDMWWLFLILALILLLLLFLLCCCLCMQRNKGDTYPVDEKERANGNDPEKELADSGFQDYQRPESRHLGRSRGSLSPSINESTFSFPSLLYTSTPYGWEDEPVKGSRASLTSTIKLDSDDEGSLNEYGDIDTGKFNEDGSFIGQYMNDKKKKKAFDSTV